MPNEKYRCPNPDGKKECRKAFYPDQLLKHYMWVLFVYLDFCDRRTRTALSVSCPHLVFVRISGKSCQVSVHCPNSVRCLDSVQILEKSCPLSGCPAGQGRDRAVRTFTLHVRRHMVFDNSDIILCDILAHVIRKLK